jgi:hypothetical protein
VCVGVVEANGRGVRIGGKTEWGAGRQTERCSDLRRAEWDLILMSQSGPSRYGFGWCYWPCSALFRARSASLGQPFGCGYGQDVRSLVYRQSAAGRWLCEQAGRQAGKQVSNGRIRSIAKFLDAREYT